MTRLGWGFGLESRSRARLQLRFGVGDTINGKNRKIRVGYTGADSTQALDPVMIAVCGQHIFCPLNYLNEFYICFGSTSSKKMQFHTRTVVLRSCQTTPISPVVSYSYGRVSKWTIACRPHELLMGTLHELLAPHEIHLCLKSEYALRRSKAIQSTRGCGWL